MSGCFSRNGCAFSRAVLYATSESIAKSLVVNAMASFVGPAHGTVFPAVTPLRRSGGCDKMAYVNLAYCFLVGEPNVASHNAALPSSFLMPSIVLAWRVNGSISVDHA